MNNKSILILIILTILFSSCRKHHESEQDKGHFSFSINTQSNTKASSDYSLDKVTKLLITLKQNDKILEGYNNKEIKLNNWGNGEYTSESISLIVGTDYQLTKFELQNSENKIIYASPYENSDLANQVNDPLPINFDVNKDRTSEINVEVLSTEEKSPSDFGYVSFNVIDRTSGNGALIGNWKKSSEYSGPGRGGAVSFTIGDDVYVGLGYSNGDYFSSFYKYNTMTSNWASIKERVDGNEIGIFPGTPRREAVAFSVNGKGYIGTGVDEEGDRLNDFWEYDPSKPIAGRWSELTSQFPGGVRQGAVAFAFDTNADGTNDVAYVGTGYGVLDGEDHNNLKDFYKFENNTWSVNMGYGGSKTTDATTFVIGDKAYLVSGVNNLDNVWEFNATSETWCQKKDIDKGNSAENVQRTSAISFVIDGKGYVTTGLGGNGREVWEYDPSKDDWVEKTSLENEVFSRVDAIGFNIDNRGFIVTGLNGQTGLGDMWEFEPTNLEDDNDND